MSSTRQDDADLGEASLREANLIDRWLDEGDRLSESARTSAPGEAAQKRRRLGEALAALRSIADRRRFAVVVGVVGVSAIAVGTMRTLSRSVLAHAVASSGTPQDPAPPVPTAAPPPPAPLPPPAPVSVAAAVPPADPMPVAAAVAPADPMPVAVAAPAMDAAPAGPVAAKVDDTLTECQTAIRRERARQALAACGKAANDNPTVAAAQVALAHANLLAGRDRETLRLARHASALDPLCGDAYLLIGTVQQSAGRPADARSAYESYLRTAPHGSHAAEIRAILKTL